MLQLSRHILTLFVYAAIGLSLVACSSPKQAYHEQLVDFGTLIDISIWDVDDATGQRLVRDIDQKFQIMNHAWHAWEPGALGRVNQLMPSGEWFSGAPSVLPLIKRCQTLSKLSGGRFNPAIGHLIKLWGFNSSSPPQGPPPKPEDIESWVSQHPSMEDVEIKGIELRSHNPAVRFDFGGYAKGLAVDYAIEYLRESGINNAIVNAGGDLRVIGRHGDRPWRVGIRNPRGEGVYASVDVEGDESVFTSGDYERYFEYEGVRYYHIIDPHTGYPARGTTSVTVFNDVAGDADAAATALFVAGPDDWYEVAKAMGVKAVMLIDNHGKVYMTPNLKQRIVFQVTPPPEITYSDAL